MTDINGKGYGDLHDWKCIGTEQMQFPRDRSTLFVCNRCGYIFTHWYHITENIHDAMKESGIKEICEGKNDN